MLFLRLMLVPQLAYMASYEW